MKIVEAKKDCFVVSSWGRKYKIKYTDLEANGNFSLDSQNYFGGLDDYID